MTRQQITFLVAGFIAGAATIAAGAVSPTVLMIGGGPIFFLAILAAIALTDGWPHLTRGFWRYVLAACVSTAAYVLALVTFWWLGGYLQNLLGSHGSNDLSEFRLDVWLGLTAAALVAAVGIEGMASVLTGKWSNLFLFCLVGVGFVAILVTFIANRYWSFFGILWPVGEGLFCGVIGAQIWRTSRFPLAAGLGFLIPARTAAPADPGGRRRSAGLSAARFPPRFLP